MGAIVNYETKEAIDTPLVRTLTTIVRNYDPSQLAMWLWESFASNNFFPVRVSGVSQPANELVDGFNSLDSTDQANFRRGLTHALAYAERFRDDNDKYGILRNLLYITGRTGTAKQAVEPLQAILSVYRPRQDEAGIRDVVATAESVVRGLPHDEAAALLDTASVDSRRKKPAPKPKKVEKPARVVAAKKHD